MLCHWHGERVEPTLGYCWKCLSHEVDPPDDLPSWWWSGYRDPESLDPEPSHVLDREQEQEYTRGNSVTFRKHPSHTFGKELNPL